jgi:hypothetical protein
VTVTVDAATNSTSGVTQYVPTGSSSNSKYPALLVLPMCWTWVVVSVRIEDEARNAAGIAIRRSLSVYRNRGREKDDGSARTQHSCHGGDHSSLNRVPGQAGCQILRSDASWHALVRFTRSGAIARSHGDTG